RAEVEGPPRPPHGRRGVRVFPPPVPPHPRERPWVGPGLHRVAHRGASAAHLRGPLPATLARRPRVLRSPGPGDCGPPGRAGTPLRNRRLLLLLLLVRRTSPARDAAGAAGGAEAPRSPLLPVLG